MWTLVFNFNVIFRRNVCGHGECLSKHTVCVSQCVFEGHLNPTQINVVGVNDDVKVCSLRCCVWCVQVGAWGRHTLDNDTLQLISANQNTTLQDEEIRISEGSHRRSAERIKKSYVPQTVLYCRSRWVIQD